MRTSRTARRRSTAGTGGSPGPARRSCCRRDAFTVTRGRSRDGASTPTVGRSTPGCSSASARPGFRPRPTGRTSGASAPIRCSSRASSRAGSRRPCAGSITSRSISGTSAPPKHDAVSQAIEECPPSPEPFSTHPDDPAFWLYSSGTTGAPKAVIHRHRDIVHAVAAYGRHVLDLRPDDRAYATSKLFFAYGLGASLYFPLAAGASAVLSPEPFSAARTWTVLAEERPTLFFAVPSVYRALLEQAPRHAAQAVAGLRRVVSAGEALPPALFHAWQARFGQEILDGLGSTEALHIFLSNRRGACTPGSPGRPVPGYDVRVVDEGGVPVAAGTPGGLLVRGDSIAAGYWQRAEATRRTFSGEWLATGDQVVENADGSFQLLGRTDDMLKVSGQWVSPPEVEGVVATVHGVRECAVIGAADNDGVTEVIACIVCTADDHDDVRARVEHACGALPRFKRPKRIVLLESLPRTATGKIQRSALRVRLGGTR